tara:strand:- start:5394 stop:5792 length:399 start_codon:yes stop_codon:yes gene_type:complete
MSTKKPDNVVFNTESNSYDASLREYPTNLGAPVIETIDTVAWKNKNLQSVNSQFKAKYDQLKKTMEDFKESFEDNQRVYKAKFNFEPLVGKIYHMYKDKKSENFLSILSPNECNFDFVGSYYLNEDKVWLKQ